MEQKPKWLLQSQTFAGIALTGLGALATGFGWTWWDAIPAPEILNHVLEVVGLVWAAWGRMRAQGPATVKKPA